MIIKCKVFTNSKFEKIEWEESLSLFKIYINAQREKGKANSKLIDLISSKLKIPKFNLKLISGFTTTIKLIEIKLENITINYIKSCLTLS